MAADWTEVRIDQIATRIAIGPFGSDIKTDNFVPAGVPVIRGGNLTSGRFHGAEFVFLTEEKARQLANATAFPGDLVFTHRGTLGQVGLVPAEPYDRYVVSQSQMLLRCDPRAADSSFIYYFFKSDAGQHALLMNTSQTGVPAISRPTTSLKAIRLLLPPLPEQRAIAHILGTLDDKIELNRRMNETLEAMALSLYKSWFVDFDPVRAKAEGRDTGLPKTLTDLFPARLVDSELGEIPAGWEVRSVGDHMVNFDSKRVPVSGAERSERQGPYPYHGAAGVMDYVDDYLFDGIHLLVGEDGSVVQNNGLAVTQYVWGEIWVNNHAHVLQGRDAVSTEQLYLYFHFEPVAPYVTGAVQPKLSQGRMNTMPFVFAGEELCRAFERTIQPWFAKLRASVSETKTLAAVRDALLPKLISGELKVAQFTDGASHE